MSIACMHVCNSGGTQPNLAQSPWDEVAQMATLRIIIARMNTHTNTRESIHVLQRIGRHRVYTHIISRAQRTHARYVEPARADQHLIYLFDSL